MTAIDRPANTGAPSALENALNTRRSIRIFAKTPIPADLVPNALRLAMLAPSSSNLQHWQFFRVREKLTDIQPVFLNQHAARTCAELVVAVARPDLWRAKNDKLTTLLKAAKNPPHFEHLLHYHTRTVPFYYDRGILGIKGFLRWMVNALIGLRRPVSRHGFFKGRLDRVAIKSTALACQTFMLAINEAGYDTCPMEGFDAIRLKKFLNLPHGAIPVMGIAVGKRSPTYVPTLRTRLDYNDVVVDI